MNNTQLEELSIYSKNKQEIEVNLIEQKINYGNKSIYFDIEEFRKKCLLEGLDDIDLSLKSLDDIKSFESKMINNKPWI